MGLPEAKHAGLQEHPDKTTLKTDKYQRAKYSKARSKDPLISACAVCMASRLAPERF